MATPMFQVTNSPQQKRHLRRPQHTFQLRHRPWQIQPFLLAPVLPGETMKNLLMQSRAVTDPIKNPLIGWWLEYYFFYVKISDLEDRDLLQTMFIQPGTDVSSLRSAAVVNQYHAASDGINYANLCLERVVDEYFRNEGESVTVATIDSLPLASVGKQSGLDSLINGDDFTAADVTVDGTGDLKASEVESAMMQWALLKQYGGLQDISYEDFLRQYGIRGTAVKEVSHKPELIRFVREWSYPSNTIDPTDGDPSSAVSWTVAERADKDRFFTEPGFVFGVTVARPKIYYKGQAGSLADYLQTAYNWLPAVLTNDWRTSYAQFVTDGTPPAGPLQGATEDYWIDLRDLFMYGDQFLNFALSETDAGLVALPTAANLKRYASSTDADALFASASPANKIRQDGVTHLSILTRQMDMSAGT